MAEEKTDGTLSNSTPEETTVSFNVDNHPVEVNLRDINRLFFDIERYNEQFSMGSMMARTFKSLFAIDDEDELHTAKTSLAEEEGSQQADAFFLIAAHKKLLDDIGLSLEPV